MCKLPTREHTDKSVPGKAQALDYFVHDFTVHIGESIAAALILEGQSLVVDA